MSATSFLRHRRATAVAYIGQHLNGRHKARIAEIMAEFNLSPDNLETLKGNTDVLSVADRIAAEQLDQPELDDLEDLNTLDVGDRASVHSPDVRADQFEARLQHPCQETVGVGNMHDAGQAAEDLANVSQQRVDEHDGSLADAAAEKAAEQADALSDHGGLPEGAPTVEPVADAQLTAEDQQPTDPNGQNPGPETIVDRDAAADQLQQQEADADHLAKLGADALSKLDRDQLLAYAERQRLTLEGIKPGTTAPTIAKQIVRLQGDA